MTALTLFADTWASIHLDFVAGVGLFAGAWAGAWIARRAKPTAREIAAVTVALLILLGTLNGPLHELSDRYLFSAHMIQHLLLTLAVPPLLLVATPGWMVDALFRGRRLQSVARACTRAVPALLVYTVVLVGWHLPAPYAVALEVHPWHVAQHLSLMASAVAAWWPILGRSAVAPPLPYAAQILYLFAFGVPMTAVAAMITGAEQVLYPFYESAPRIFGLAPMTDQQLGGVLMWVPAGTVPLVAMTIVFFRWAVEEREVDEPLRP
jgi:putative membrane protein